MKTSYKLLSLFGIPIEMNISFLFLIGFLLFTKPTFALLMLVVFTFITLHELSHSLVAKALGIKVQKITLFIIGGMASMNITRIKPVKEILVSIAGPLFNFFTCFILIGVMKLLNLPFENSLDTINQMNLSLPLLIYYSFYANLILGSFNLFLPAFPLDGGRIYRALLSFKLGKEKATLIARNTSYAIAFLLLVYSLIPPTDLWFILIAGFIYLGAKGEYNALLDSIYLSKVKVGNLLSTDFLVGRKEEPAREAVEKMRMIGRKYAVVEDDFSIFNADKVDDLNKPLKKYSMKVPVLSLNSSLETALHKMEQLGVPLLPVVENGELIGIVKASDIYNFERMSRLLKNKYVKRVFKL